jgi:uncharacterized protein YajQ (UPF0234 family)
MKKVLSILISIFLYTGIAFADEKLALAYNIVPDDDSKKGSIIDSKTQKKLSFKLFKDQGPIYFNGKEVSVTNGKFELDINELYGKQEIKFTNNENEEAIFTYYISNANGLVKDYELENKETYIKTIDNTKIIYTSKDAKKIDFVSDLITSMPDKTKTNLKEMVFLPTEHSSKAAGITVYNKVTFYNISKYSDKQIKNIIFHEVAHTWSYDLMGQKVLDYSFTDFSKAISEDNNFVSNYSKGKASEDFAESIAFYLINPDSFTKNYPARADYIENLLK